MLEDMDTDAELIQREMKRGEIDFLVTRVLNKPSFEKAFDSFKPDLILSDYSLPAYDGISALEYVRKHDSEIPFIFVTGAMGEEWAIETFKRGATDYVLKDKLSRLVPVIKRALEEVIKQSELRNAELALYESEKKYRQLVDNSLAGIFIAQDLIIKFCNQRFAELFGYKKASDLYNKSIKEFVKDSSWGTVRTQLESKETIDNPEMRYDFEGNHCKGNHLVLEAIGNFIIYNGQPAIQGTVINITERKQNETKLKNSLKEKNILIKEVHHRVKNNMQIIQSLLRLQAQYIQDEATKNAFQESQNRIYSLALVHEKLYCSDDFTFIDFKDYINSLISSLSLFYNTARNPISISTDIKDLNFSIDQAIPCGLIINELVTNAMKHAFPEDFQGKREIVIRAHKKHENILLSIIDNGIGLQKAHKEAKKESLGLNLITILTEDQLEGKVAFSSTRKGTTVDIEFPYDSDFEIKIER